MQLAGQIPKDDACAWEAGQKVKMRLTKDLRGFTPNFGGLTQVVRTERVNLRLVAVRPHGDVALGLGHGNVARHRHVSGHIAADRQIPINRRVAIVEHD